METERLGGGWEGEGRRRVLPPSGDLEAGPSSTDNIPVQDAGRAPRATPWTLSADGPSLVEVLCPELVQVPPLASG